MLDAGEESIAMKKVAPAATEFQKKKANSDGVRDGVRQGIRTGLQLKAWARRSSDTRAAVAKAAAIELEAAMPRGRFKRADPARLGRAIAVACKHGVDASKIEGAKGVIKSWNGARQIAAQRARAAKEKELADEGQGVRV